jgi:hypothetical protein
MENQKAVMPGLVPGIHVIEAQRGREGADGRDKRGHDDDLIRVASTRITYSRSG